MRFHMTQGRWRCVNWLIHEILQSPTLHKGVSLANREYSHKRGMSASVVDKRFTRCLLLYGDLFAFWKIFLNRWSFKEGNPSHSSVVYSLCRRIITWQLEFHQTCLKSQQKRKTSQSHWENVSHCPTNNNYPISSLPFSTYAGCVHSQYSLHTMKYIKEYFCRAINEQADFTT